MRMPWTKSHIEQLDLVDEVTAESSESPGTDIGDEVVSAAAPSRRSDALTVEGVPLMVPVDCLEEDPANPRTELPDEEIAELAQDVALRGILQPIVVRRAPDNGRYRVVFGGKRLRAAKQANLDAVPVVIGSQAHDVYDQVAENQKRDALTPLDLARFMRSRADAGDSNAEIARRMGIDLTSVAHHLALLTLPPELDEALRSGRCPSPRTLYELARLHKTKPERVKAIVASEGDITRRAVRSLTQASRLARGRTRKAVPSRRPASLVGQANICVHDSNPFSPGGSSKGALWAGAAGSGLLHRAHSDGKSRTSRLMVAQRAHGWTTSRRSHERTLQCSAAAVEETPSAVSTEGPLCHRPAPLRHWREVAADPQGRAPGP